MYNIKRVPLFLLLAILIGSLTFFIKPITSSKYKTEITPTVLIHGFKGGPNTYNSMIKRLTDRKPMGKRTFIVVSSAGNLSIRGNPSPPDSPFIQLIFQNDRASIAQQTIWIQKVLKTLYDQYDITQVNIVGHSMGGLTAFNFLLNNQENDYPKVKKLVLIASPFKGIRKNGYFTSNYGPAATDLMPNSKALNHLAQNKENFDNHVEVLSIAGVINKGAPKGSQWDGLVHLISALGMKDIIPARNYREEIIYDRHATHSGLHEHAKVDQFLTNFLWE